MSPGLLGVMSFVDAEQPPDSAWMTLIEFVTFPRRVPEQGVEMDSAFP